jgi:glycosyltransferase involved in cell wall biosynthesis
MMTTWWVFGLLMAWFWWSRFFDARRGMPAVADISTAEWDRMPDPSPRVSIIVPARNEGEGVLGGLTSLLALDYPNYEIIAADDRSTDATGAFMDQVAAQQGRELLRVLHVRELPAGWMGKQHAMWLAAQQATGDWLLFTDADVRFRPDAVRRAIAFAECACADHLVLFPSHALSGFGEKIFMAGFQVLFALGHRPWRVADPDSADFIGLGPFNLVRRSAYEQIGTWAALKLEVIEDMKLGKLIKQHRLAQRNVFGPGLLPWRWGKGALGLSRNLTKNMFSLLQFRWGKAIGALLLLLALNFLPLGGAIWAPGWSKAPYFVALACIAGIHIGMSRRTQVPGWTFLFYPISALMMAATLIRSMIHAARHGGVIWRGTRYSLEELRKGWV